MFPPSGAFQQFLFFSFLYYHHCRGFFASSILLFVLLLLCMCAICIITAEVWLKQKFCRDRKYKYTNSKYAGIKMSARSASNFTPFVWRLYLSVLTFNNVSKCACYKGHLTTRWKCHCKKGIKLFLIKTQTESNGGVLVAIRIVKRRRPRKLRTLCDMIKAKPVQQWETSHINTSPCIYVQLSNIYEHTHIRMKHGFFNIAQSF